MKKLLLTIVIFLAVPSISHAMKFDGVSNTGVTIGNINALHASSSDLTISLWIRPNVISAGIQGIVVMGNAGSTIVPYAVELNRTVGRISFSQAGTGGGAVSVTNTSDIKVNEWHHIVITRKYNTATNWTTNLYLNGLPNGSGTNGRFGGTSQVLAIGRYGANTVFNFSGDIVDVRMYDRVLTPQEAKGLYYGYDIYSGLISRWILDGNSLPFVPNGAGKFNGSATGGVLKSALPPRLKLFDNYK